MEVFEYSPELKQMIIHLLRGKEGLPKYETLVNGQLGGPGSRLLLISNRDCPEIEYHCGSLRNKRVLDFGCGMGVTTAALAQYCDDLSAFDISEESMAICRQRLKEHGLDGKVKMYRADSLEEVKQSMGTFDVIVAYAVFEHIPASIPGLRERVFKSVWSLLKKNGYLYISDTPNRLHPYDVHSTQLWWIPWSKPGSLWAYKRGVAKGRYTDVENFSKGPLGMEEHGAWGVTYWEIKRYLAGLKHEVLNIMPGHDRFIWYTLHKTRKLNPLKALAYLIVVRLLRMPLTAFRPYIENLFIMRK